MKIGVQECICWSGITYKDVFQKWNYDILFSFRKKLVSLGLQNNLNIFVYFTALDFVTK